MSLVEFGESIWYADGPEVSFYGFPYPTRMVVVRLSDGSAWIWSPIELTPELIEAVERIGPVRHILSPNKIHHLFMPPWAACWPDAIVYAPPGLASRRPDIHFDKELDDQPDEAWADDIDQVIFRGSSFMEEVVFFHRASRTAIVCDLIQRHPRTKMRGFRGKLMQLDGLVGEKGSTPREWRASFLRRKLTRRAREKVVSWNADKLLIAHGDNVASDAAPVIERALAWI